MSEDGEKRNLLSLQDLISRAYNLNARIQQQVIALRRTIIYLDGQPPAPDQRAQMLDTPFREYWKQIIPVN
jgi:hypothetical protein